MCNDCDDDDGDRDDVWDEGSQDVMLLWSLNGAKIVLNGDEQSRYCWEINNELENCITISDKMNIF